MNSLSGINNAKDIQTSRNSNQYIQLWLSKDTKYNQTKETEDHTTQKKELCQSLGLHVKLAVHVQHI